LKGFEDRILPAGTDEDELTRIPDRERPEDHRADKCVDGGRRADADGERQRRDDGERRRLAQRSNGVPQVLQEAFHE
jgi:hypothetical protein